MTYQFDRGNGQSLTIEGAGEQTHLHVSSGGPGQQQSQGSRFHTGEWTEPPSLFQKGEMLLVVIETNAGRQYLAISGNGIRHGREALDLDGAKELKLVPASPLEPMRPMAPMQPLKPMPRMRKMEMGMGNMHMSMGAPEQPEPPGERFCTECGRKAGPDDRFCGGCGQKIGAS